MIEFDTPEVKPAKAKPALIKSITNVHPADELAELRAQKAALDKRIDALRDQLMEDGADLTGDEYRAVLVPSVRETLDRKAITEAYGEKAIAPFIKKTSFSTVKLEKK
jgi:hypothetical protein